MLYRTVYGGLFVSDIISSPPFLLPQQQPTQRG